MNNDSLKRALKKACKAMMTRKEQEACYYMDIKQFYDIKDKAPEVFRRINFDLIVVDSGMFKPSKYYRYNPKIDELEEINFEKNNK